MLLASETFMSLLWLEACKLRHVIVYVLIQTHNCQVHRHAFMSRTLWGRAKMADILQKTFSNTFSTVNLLVFRKFLPKRPINYKPVLIQIIAGRRRRLAIIWTNDALLTDTYVGHSATISWWVRCHILIYHIMFHIELFPWFCCA